MNSSHDVIIVGGAVHGASLAYHLAADPGFDGSVLLIEKDPSFAFAATALSAGSIRQQFSSAINIAISLHGIEFLRSVGERLEVDGERPDIGLHEGGYLYPRHRRTARRRSHVTMSCRPRWAPTSCISIRTRWRRAFPMSRPTTSRPAPGDGAARAGSTATR